MEFPVAPADEGELDPVEAAEQIVQRARREHPQVRGIVLRSSPAQEPEPALDAERVRDGADEDAPRPQHAARLGDERVRELQVLEELARDDGVEALVLEREGI